MNTNRMGLTSLFGGRLAKAKGAMRAQKGSAPFQRFVEALDARLDVIESYLDLDTGDDTIKGGYGVGIHTTGTSVDIDSDGLPPWDDAVLYGQSQYAGYITSLKVKGKTIDVNNLPISQLDPTGGYQYAGLPIGVNRSSNSSIDIDATLSTSGWAYFWLVERGFALSMKQAMGSRWAPSE